MKEKALDSSPFAPAFPEECSSREEKEIKKVR